MMTITATIKRGRERVKSRGKGRKKPVEHNATVHHLLIGAQPVP